MFSSSYFGSVFNLFSCVCFDGLIIVKSWFFSNTFSWFCAWDASSSEALCLGAGLFSTLLVSMFPGIVAVILFGAGWSDLALSRCAWDAPSSGALCLGAGLLSTLLVSMFPGIVAVILSGAGWSDLTLSRCA